MIRSRRLRLNALATALFAPLLATGLTARSAEALPVDDGRSEVFALNLDDGGVVAAHALSGANAYQSYLLQKKTPLPAPPADERANWVYKLADFDGDRVTDLFAIDKDDDGWTSVHVLDGADDFQSYLLHIRTPLGATTAWNWQLDAGDFNADGRADLYLLNKDNGGHTAVFVLDGANYFQVYSMATNTPLGVANDPLWQFDVADFNRDNRADLYAIYKNDQGHTAVHVLDAGSGFQTWTMHTLTPLGSALDPNWQFDVGDYSGDHRADLYAFYRNDQGHTAVHVLDAASSFQGYTLHKLTPLPALGTDPTWQLAVGLDGIGAIGPPTDLALRTAEED
jgi:hypothetical protein